MDQMTAIGWPLLRRHPGFRAAVERNAANIIAQKDQLSPLARWLTNDLGRTAVLTRLLFHTAQAGAVTAADLVAQARQRRTSSEGRVLQVLQRAEAAGWIRIEPGSRDWKARPLVAQPTLIDLWRERARIEIDSASLLAPETTPAVALLASDGGLLSFLGCLARFDSAASDLREPAGASIRLFLTREGGLAMLYDLIGRQDPGRARLLDTAPLSRVRLARRFNVARSHVGRLFAEAAGAGYLSLPTPGRVIFSQTMSEAAERHFAQTFHVVAASALVALAERSPSSAIAEGSCA